LIDEAERVLDMISIDRRNGRRSRPIPESSSMPAEPDSHPWRSFLRFSVRGLLVLVLLVAAGLGWMVRSARIQREAVRAIMIAGGRVNYDRGQKIGKSTRTRVMRPPKWLSDAVGVDYFYSVAKVWFLIPLTSSPSASETDAALAHVGRLTRLKWLIVIRPLSDAGLVHLKGLESLTDLHLSGTQITDAGLAHLKGLTNLSSIDLSETKVSDAGVVHLKGLAKLEVLYLGRTQVTDAGLVHLKGLTQLSWLDLSDVRVTDAGLANLNDLKNLTDLNLGSTEVTDAGLANLQGLTKLSMLDLSGTQITDAGLVHLKRLTKLYSLSIGGTKVSVAGMKNLRQALPNAKIWR
jgi:internalin A